MRIERVLQSLAAGSVIYVVMAACAATDHPASVTPDGSTSAASDAPASAFDAVVDVLTDPVREASAAPEAATEPCNKTFNNNYYAEHSYPGASVADLANVRTLVVSSSGDNLPGYTHFVITSWVKDGAVGVVCGTTASAASMSILFVKP